MRPRQHTSLSKPATRISFSICSGNVRETRGIAVWAALESLGKQRLATMIESNCRHARLPTALKKPASSVLNEMALNQVPEPPTDKMPIFPRPRC